MYVKVARKIRKKFKIITSLRKGHDLSGQVLHRGETFFFAEPGHVIHQKTQNFM